MRTVRIKILVDNRAGEPWQSEHGLSLCLEYGTERMLFDSGAGCALPVNLLFAGIDPTTFTKVILSHGHNDHTGGVADVLKTASHIPLYHAPGVEAIRFSLHQGQPPHDISMPETVRQALLKHPERHVVDGFTKIASGIHLTGAIPRYSFEDCGGPFYFDIDGKIPDLLNDEQSLLFDSGVLITGCCHAGIINTVEYCRVKRPGIAIHTIVGGLHLLHASPDRLLQTSDYLNSLHLKRLILLHCTGDAAAEYLKKCLNCEVLVGQTGDEYHE